MKRPASTSVRGHFVRERFAVYRTGLSLFRVRTATVLWLYVTADLPALVSATGVDPARSSARGS